MTQMDVPPGANNEEQNEKEKKMKALQYAKETLALIIERGVDGNDYDRSMARISNMVYGMKIIRPDLYERIYREVVPNAGIHFIRQGVEELSKDQIEPLASYGDIIWHQGRKVAACARSFEMPMSNDFRKAILKFIARDAQIIPDARYASIYLEFIGEKDEADKMKELMRERRANESLESSDEEIREQINQLHAAYAEFMHDIEHLVENKVDLRQVCSEILQEVENELAKVL